MSPSDQLHHRIVIEVKGGLGEDFTPNVEAFKKDHGVHFVLAFSGGADDSSPFLHQVVDALKGQETLKGTGVDFEEMVNRAKKQYLASIVYDILRPFQGYRMAVLTGGTAWGVPAIATEVAKELGFPTIGVFPLAATLKKKNMLPEHLLDLAICVHPMVGTSQWGDESAVYTKLLDAVVIIGGGAGTMVEVAHLLKQNEKEGVHIKHMIPISGTGGTADKVSFFPGKPKVMAKCVPAHPITDGPGACVYLKQNIVPEDIYD